MLRGHALLIDPIESKQASPSEPSQREIYEVNSVSLERIPESALAPGDIADGYPVTVPDVPRNHSPEVLSVRSSLFDGNDAVPLLPEHGPCLVDGTVTVDDKSYTTKLQIHAGPA